MELIDIKELVEGVRQNRRVVFDRYIDETNEIFCVATCRPRSYNKVVHLGSYKGKDLFAAYKGSSPALYVGHFE